MEARPISFKNLCKFIEQNHRHHRPPQGYKFGIAAYKNQNLVGVVAVGRPVSRFLDDGITAEVTRLCSDGTKNVCSFLYGRAARAARAMGFKRVITYTLESERGESLRGAGWKRVGNAGGGSWSRPSRKRYDKAPTERKVLWEA